MCLGEGTQNSDCIVALNHDDDDYYYYYYFGGGVTEAVYRLRDQRAAVVSLHAQEPQLVQVSRLETRRVVAVRVLHHGDDRHEHHHSYDEGPFYI